MATEQLSTEKQPKVILYWLNYSRSHRILWLLEELNIDYELKIFERDHKTMRAPPELKEIHPLGKSPVISVDGKVIGESGFIVEYLLSKFDKDNKLTPTDEDGKIDLGYYLHYAEGTLQPILSNMIVFELSDKWGIDTNGGQAFDSVLEKFYIPELISNFDFLESKLKNQQYFIGNKLSGADIMLSFQVEFAFERKAAQKFVDNYPNLKNWLARCNSNKVKQKCDEMIKQFQK